jgi:hypothetical protein
MSYLHFASPLIAVPAFIACAQDRNHCGQVRYPPIRRPGAQVVGHGREVLALVELGPVTLEALPDGVLDVAGQGGGGLAVALQEQHGRPGLVGDAPPESSPPRDGLGPAGGAAAARPRSSARPGGTSVRVTSRPGRRGWPAAPRAREERRIGARRLVAERRVAYVKVGLHVRLDPADVEAFILDAI